MNMNIKKTIFKIAMIAMITSYLAVIYLFFGAYFYEDKYIIVAINFFGEADIEAILLLITMPCVIYFLLSKRDAIINMDF